MSCSCGNWTCDGCTPVDDEDASLDAQVARLREQGDDVFVLRGEDGSPEWHASVAGRLLGGRWSDRGAAVAGVAVERRRLAKRAGK